ncbi:hypothetical protein FOZ63_016081 [Perkinsus olseni]|uniref:Mei2-like C-terminal RNA recognition motif domain-containing protein n=1 Tax=Perkinsus olseni TaxID=32597 RepID=A0A7J6TMC2_PEROL|nr:hypothetical protein FOZ63_016081 [Perkinsus olseni]
MDNPPLPPPNFMKVSRMRAHTIASSGLQSLPTTAKTFRRPRSVSSSAGGTGFAHKRVPQRIDLTNQALANPDAVAYPTTLMLRNIPNGYTQGEVLAEIDSDLGFKGTYDFFYMPSDVQNKCNVGYGFINFRTANDCTLFQAAFEKYHFRKFNSKKIGKTCFGHIQGLEANISHFKKAHVGNWDADRPLVFLEDGRVVSVRVAASILPLRRPTQPRTQEVLKSSVLDTRIGAQGSPEAVTSAAAAAALSATGVGSHHRSLPQKSSWTSIFDIASGSTIDDFFADVEDMELMTFMSMTIPHPSMKPSRDSARRVREAIYYAEPENTTYGNASTGGFDPSGDGSSRGAEWIMHLPLDGSLEHLTEKMLHHFLNATIDATSTVTPTYLTVRVLDGVAGDMPIIAECCIGFADVDLFREFLLRHVQGGQDAVFCAEVMTMLRKTAAQAEPVNHLGKATSARSGNGRVDEVSPVFVDLHRIMMRRGSCAPMTIRSQMDRKAEWVRGLNRREVLALRSYLEACLRRGKEVTWTEFIKHVPAAVDSTRASGVGRQEFIKSARSSRGGSLDSRRDSSLLTAGGGGGGGGPFDESRMWSGRGREGSLRLDASTMTSSRRSPNTPGGLVPTGRFDKQASVRRETAVGARLREENRNGNDRLMAKALHGGRGSHPPRAHSAGASTGRRQRVDRQERRHSSLVADTSVHPPETAFTPAANRTYLEPSPAGGLQSAMMADYPDRTEQRGGPPQVVDTWIEPPANDSYIGSYPNGPVLSAPLLTADGPGSLKKAGIPLVSQLLTRTILRLLQRVHDLGHASLALNAFQLLRDEQPDNSASAVFWGPAEIKSPQLLCILGTSSISDDNSSPFSNPSRGFVALHGSCTHAIADGAGLSARPVKYPQA